MGKFPSRVFPHRKLLSFSLWDIRLHATCSDGPNWGPKGRKKKIETGALLISGSDALILFQILPTNSVRKCIEINLEKIEDDFTWPLTLGQVSFKSYLPSKKIYLSRSRTGLFLSPCFDNLPVVCIHRSLRIQSSRSDSRYLCSNPVRECYRRNWTLGTSFLRLSAFLLYAIRMNYDQTEEEKITSNKYITEWSAGFLSSSTQHYCLTFESEKKYISKHCTYSRQNPCSI